MFRPVRSRRVFGGGVLFAAVVAMTATVTRTPAPGAAGDPFVAGQHGLASRPVSDSNARLVTDRAARAATVLGLPPAARRSVTHVVDRFGGGEYDEVTEFDSRGRPIALQRFDVRGTIAAAVRFGWQAGGDSRLATDGAVLARAGELAAGVGLDLGAPGLITRRSVQTGWTVAWTRTVDGARVLGDGIRVQVWPDGSFHSLSVAEHPLAAVPSWQVDRATAIRIATSHLDRWFAGPQRPQISTTTAELVWTAPNDAFAPDRPDAPSSVYRLAWRVGASASGSLAGRIRALEIDIDAGDATLLGGDVLE
jgi:hypothetical protein